MTTEHYHGSCQCGAVAYDADVDISAPIICNCSRCRRLGSVLAFTRRTSFTLLKGEDALTEYTFNRHAIHHQFCKICGIQPFAYGQMPDGTKMVAINVNCLDVDARALPARHVDGAAS
jgi:hypothetical protein